MDNQTPETNQKCPHDGAYPPDLLKQLHHDCPADLSFWCGSRILECARELEARCQVEGWDYYDKLYLNFRHYVEDAIRLCFPGVQVFWATREKPKPAEMPDPGKGTQPPGSRLLNEIIVDLNRRYHAHKLLHALAQFSVGRSHIFTITGRPEGATLTCHPMARRDANHERTAAWPIDIRFHGTLTVAELCRDLCKDASDKGPSSRDELATSIRNQIERWAEGATWPKDYFRDNLTNDIEYALAEKIERDARQQPGKKLSFAERYVEAVKHIALIALYQENNAFSAMTYILAPTLSGESAASLVIYWPRIDGHGSEAPPHLLYLLQMILGQNATTILAKDREGRQARRLAEARKVALSHYGHTLKHRLDVLNAFLDAEAPSAVRLRANMLKDLTLILQLNAVDDREELCERLPEQKRKRFMDLEGVEDAPSELDLLPRIQEWSEVLTREEDVPLRDVSGRIETRVRCPVQLKLFPRITSASIGWQMTSAGQDARLKEPVFRELLFELLNNIWKYGERVLLMGEDGNSYVQINVRVTKANIVVSGNTISLLVLANIIQPAKVGDCPLIAEQWKRWPDKGDIRYNGPGMALDLFRRLELGDMYHRTRTHNGKVILEVGMAFAELHLTSDLGKE